LRLTLDELSIHTIIGKRLTVREAATRLKMGKTALYTALRNP
jgi:hypothetical protein